MSPAEGSSHIAALGGRVGCGDAPALCIVDMTLGFTDPAAELACDVHGVIDAVQGLLERARLRRRPIIFTTVGYEGYEERSIAAQYLAKIPAMDKFDIDSRWVEVDPRIAPRSKELVIRKLFASAFFSTPLSSFLTAKGVDTLIVAGVSTSGCVRATVVDGMQHGFRVLLPREATGDRSTHAHEQTLRDIDGRYGDVVSTEEAISCLGGLA